MKKISKTTFLASLILAITFVGCNLKKTTQNSINNLYFNGDIITMETDAPQHVEAIVESGGKIIFVGSLQEAENKFKNLNKIDLNGKTLLPGFIDPHSHFCHVANAMGQINLNPPPVGDVTNIPQILEKLKTYKENNNIPDGEWIFATGYDDNELIEKRHPTNKEIDKALPNNPVYLEHASGHMGVANSMALSKMNVNAETKNPAGGNIGRYPNSNEPNGLVQETAMYPFAGNMLHILGEKFPDFFDITQNHYAENGITTAQDGMTDRNKIAFFKEKAKNKKLIIDIIALAGFSDLENNLKDSDIKFKKYQDGFKVQGTKIISDGSPQGKTAFFSQPYHTQVPGCTHNCTGLPSIDQETMNKFFLIAYKNDNQLFIHCNGDAAIDMVIKAHENACKQLNQDLKKDRRTVIVHSQFVRPDQLNTFVEYNLVPSFFTNHAFFWGDVHVQNLGRERAEFLSPLATADKLGLKYTNHSDATVTPVNPLLGIWSAVNRTSRTGKIIGEKERITPYQALKAVTINAAYEHFDENIKGSLKEGKLADFVILDKNPLKEDPINIKEIKVMETIKEGKSIFKAKDENQVVNKYWKLIQLDGQPVKMAENQEKEQYFTLKSDGTFTGFAGCNYFNGTYKIENGNRIRFDENIAVTLQLCPDVNIDENAFLEIFKLADNYTIYNDTLNLNVGRRFPLAIFEAVYF